MVVVMVPEMACRHDVRAISAHVGDVCGVAAFQVDLGTKTVAVDGDVSAEAIGAAIVAAGFSVMGAAE